MDNKINIMIVDDHAVVRLGLASILEKNDTYNVCCDAETSAETFEKIATSAPDLILLDYKLPDGDGVTMCYQIKKKYPDIKIIIVSAFCDDYIIKEALQAGADGYLMKTIDRKMILSSIERVLSGEKSFDPSLIHSLVNPAQDKELHTELTLQEIEIISRIAQGFTNKEIGKEMFIAEKTVRNYISRIFEKIGVNNRTEAALFWIDRNK
ncbi:MAG: DNA-binding response regulator [Firmicutes bacterium HGW-Firmicutes-2]|nr:MAG: DNA-binding response regulator [Firmicutes bacterium HGW-Firmicutes-2]